MYCYRLGLALYFDSSSHPQTFYDQLHIIYLNSGADNTHKTVCKTVYFIKYNRKNFEDCLHTLCGQQNTHFHVQYWSNMRTVDTTASPVSTDIQATQQSHRTKVCVAANCDMWVGCSLERIHFNLLAETATVPCGNNEVIFKHVGLQ